MKHTPETTRTIYTRQQTRHGIIRWKRETRSQQKITKEDTGNEYQSAVEKNSEREAKWTPRGGRKGGAPKTKTWERQIKTEPNTSKIQNKQEARRPSIKTRCSSRHGGFRMRNRRERETHVDLPTMTGGSATSCQHCRKCSRSLVDSLTNRLLSLAAEAKKGEGNAASFVLR